MPATKPNAFAMGRYGTVVPCATFTPLASELDMLGRLIGTDSPQGRAEARGVVERAELNVTAAISALRWAVGMAEEAITTREAGDDPDDTSDILDMHRAELIAARAALASLEGQSR